MVATRTLNAWARYAWAAGILYEHHGRLLVVTYLSVVYAAMFLIYLSKRYDLLRRDADRAAALVGFIDSHRGRFGVEPACAVLEFPASAYYAAKKRARAVTPMGGEANG